VEDKVEDETDDVNGVKYLYYDETWSKNNFTFDPPHMTFSDRKDTMRNFHRMPTILAL
jgi:hypothetical protein